MVSDRVGDFIIRLQNAAMIGKKEVTMPYSGHLFSIAKKLEGLGFVSDVKLDSGDGAKKEFTVFVKYDEHGVAKLRGVKRISKPGRRLYAPHTAVHKVMGGTGARIISSHDGIITDEEARKTKTGGENLFEIW